MKLVKKISLPDEKFMVKSKLIINLLFTMWNRRCADVDRSTPIAESSTKIIDRKGLDVLLTQLREQQYTVVGPTLKNGAIVYDPIVSTADLPIGWSDEQNNGSYRLQKKDHLLLFGYGVGPHSWKQFLFPSRLRLWGARHHGKGFQFVEDHPNTERYALLGVRPCELHAIARQDNVFFGGQFSDSYYKRHREQLLLIVVNCTQAGGTCFCHSMKTGPRADSGFDLALTEILEGENHYFLLELGSNRGREWFDSVPGKKAEERELVAARQSVEQARQSMGRSLDTEGLKEFLYRNIENPYWDEISSRCLTCSNCTLVCPTCFCSNVEDVTSLTGQEAERWRTWDSCFTTDFSYIHGGSVRSSPKARYRQWMMHKLANWVDQFGEFGCVGCGRCITWCPVGIDLTEEIRKLRAGDVRMI